MSTSPINKTNTINGLLLLFKGVQANVPPDTVLTLDGVKYTGATLASELQKLIDSFNAVESTRATWQAAIVSDRALKAQTATLVASLKATILAMFTSKPDVLAQFGLKARKVPAKPTAVELLQRTANAAATRALRNTRGPKQKAKIKGHTAPVTMPPVIGQKPVDGDPNPSPINHNPNPPATPSPAPAAHDASGHNPANGQ
jgi:hypothetical protein